MTENNFLMIASSALPEAGSFSETLEEQVEYIGVDSPDLIILRTALEEALSKEINLHVRRSRTTFRRN